MSSSHNFSISTLYTGSPYNLRSSWGEVQDIAYTVSRIGLALSAFYATGRIAGNLQAKHDLAWLAGAVLLTKRNLVYHALGRTFSASTCIYVIGALALQVIAAMVRLQRGNALQDRGPPKPSLLKPMLFPCRTTHTRLFPSKHSFSYSYLLVGVPVGWDDIPGSMLSVGEKLVRQGWFSVRADDYLSRGSHSYGLNGKLQTFLQSQGVPVNRYPHAYLVTAPRFLGFSFNPVSFWYLYDRDWRLSAMILEVNNTFDERRLYFLNHEAHQPAASADVFSNSWAKDFHVSPFNDRHGSYSLTAKDIMSDTNTIKVDNNIVLKDNEGKAKIVARVFSIEPGIDPSWLSEAGRWTVLAKWGWVGFLTNPRILKEARVLWVKKLQLYYRPEVFRSSIGRNDSIEERNIEPCFRAFLDELATDANIPTSITYKPAAGPDLGTAVRLPKFNGRHMTDAVQSIDIDVLTPAFYGELARSRSIGLAFTRLCFEAEEGQAMLSVSNHEALRQMLQAFASKNSHSLPSNERPSIRQSLVSVLRVGSKNHGCGLNMIRRLARKAARPSEFDLYVKLSLRSSSYEAYLRNVGRLLLADRTALGVSGILSVECFLVQFACIAHLSSMVVTLCFHRWHKADLAAFFMWTVAFHTLKALLGLGFQAASDAPP